MRKNNETPICSFVVNLYGDTEQIHSPSGSGEESENLYNNVKGLAEPLQNAIQEQVGNLFQEQQGQQDWTLRTEVQQIV